MESANKKAEDQRVRKPAPPQVQGKEAELSPESYEALTPVAHGLHQLPTGPGTRPLRQAAVLQMQRTHGNAYVMRQVGEPQEVQAPPAGAAPAAEEGSTPTRISDGAATVETAGGIVNISGGMINIDSAMMRSSGIMQASTIIADSVIASSYTPGAGNVW